jgi:hypothetical protein
MRLPKTASFVKIEKQYNSLGQYTGENVVVLGEISCDIQPYSSRLAEATYGVSLNVTSRLFCRPDELLQLGSILKYENKKYLVNSIMDFDKHYEVLMELVQDEQV